MKLTFRSGCVLLFVAIVSVGVLALAAPGLFYPFLRGEQPTEVHLILLDRNNNPVPNAELKFSTRDEQVIFPIPFSSGRVVRRPIYATTDHTAYCRINFHAKDCNLEEVLVAGEPRKPIRQHNFGRPLPPSENTVKPDWWGGPGKQVYVTQIWIE